jgi:hypothetical protein
VLLAVLLAVSLGVSAWRTESALSAAEREDAAIPAPHAARNEVRAEDALAWLARNPARADPYGFRPNEVRIAQVRFLLAHSTPDESVVTDWLNPPYRALPGGYHDGSMIARLASAVGPNSPPKVRAALARYDSTYRDDAAPPDVRVIRLLDYAAPAVILLDGTMAELFLDSAGFREWLNVRYRIVWDDASRSLFAVRRDEAPR